MKISLVKPVSGYNLAAINDNFVKLEQELQDKVLYRDNPEGEPNAVITDLDMNGKRILNLSELQVGGVNISGLNSAVVWRGTWSGATAYARNDAVYHSGSSYICVTPNTNSAPPSANWNLFAAQGATGAGTGDVLGPVSATLDTVATYASGTGKSLKASGVAISSLALAGPLGSSGITGAQPAGSGVGITSLPNLTAGGLPDNSVLTADIANQAVTPAKLSQPLTLATAVATTSGNAIDFTSIPAWANRITVMFNAVSTAGTSPPIIQIGAGSIQTTGYTATGNNFNNASGTSGNNSTTGFLINVVTASDTLSGHMLLTRVSGNIWVSSHTAKLSTGNVCVGSGDVNLSGTLDRLRLTTSSGGVAFDGGSVNILIEG